jgi:hypothetical protein
MLIIFLDTRLFTENSSWQAKQSIPHTTITVSLRENVPRLRPELWRQRNWLLHPDNAPSKTSYFTRKFLTKSKMTVVHHLPYFSLYPPLKIKLKGTTEVNEEGLQAVQNTLTKLDFRMHFKK